MTILYQIDAKTYGQLENINILESRDPPSYEGWYKIGFPRKVWYVGDWSIKARYSLLTQLTWNEDLMLWTMTEYSEFFSWYCSAIYMQGSLYDQLHKWGAGSLSVLYNLLLWWHWSDMNIAVCIDVKPSVEGWNRRYSYRWFQRICQLNNPDKIDVQIQK